MAITELRQSGSFEIAFAGGTTTYTRLVKPVYPGKD
jgi:hypothetical protein